MVSKEILKQYCDLQKEILETRNRIHKLEKQIDDIENEKNVVDSVKGGPGGVQRFKIQGFPYPEYNEKKMSLYLRKSNLELLERDLLDTTRKVEEFITSINDSRIRRIFTMRYIDGYKWEKIGRLIGGGNNADSVRKAHDRYLEKIK